MTGNKAYLAEYQDFNGGPDAFRRRKLPDENQVLLRIPRQNNMYSFNLKNIVPSGGLACLIAKTTIDESNKWHRRLGHVNFKNLNKIVKGNLVRGDLKKKLNLLRLLCTAIWSFFIFNRSGVQTSKYACEAPNKHHDLTTDDKPATRKKFAKNTRVFAFQAEAAKASSTNIVNTAITPVSTAILMSIPTQGFNSILLSTRNLRDPQSQFPTRSKVTKSSKAHLLKKLPAIQDSKVWILVDLPYGMKAIGTKWEYGKIDEEVYVSQPPGFIDPKYPKKVYKVVKALYGLHQAPRAWYATLSTFLLKNGYRRGTIDKTLFIKKDKHDIILVQVYVDDIIFGSTKKSWCDEFEALMKSRFQMSSMGELTFFLGLQVKQKEDGIFISQDKYVAEILKKFDFVSVKTASTPIETQKPLVKDEEASDVDVHLYRSMIGSLMYLTASRPDIMFAVCACSRFQVTPKTSHLSAVKRIFRYLKGKPKLGLWYPRVSSFDLEAYSDSDYAGANLDRKSTTGGCQFLGRRLISWQCKKQTIVATSTTEAEYVAAANCCRQVLWIQNQMLDYGFNFMNTKIYIDNESTICIVKNPVYHSKTKHIAIRHHFIRDAYEKKLIQVLKIHTDDNVADLLTKAFDVSRESLGRALDGTEALLLPKLFILWLAKVSTDSAKLIPLGKDSTAIETLKKIPPRV
ncbi:putative ribonuclease H-like domain-containing protein [Tanacetum coccineum]|uniref:Ribonuclease H-like domain-containing protein n=1 Tax=Tanacetum coccineum TaxID=301880 RepID=A0ABQ4YGV5_9ASTR